LGKLFKSCTEDISEYDGLKKDPIVAKHASCALPEPLVPESLFPNLPGNCQPIAVKSTKYNKDDNLLDNKLQKDDIFEPSRSPWPAQAVVVQTNGKTRMCVDYSQSINL